MLTRIFRVTDKFSNAFLKIAVWLSQALLMQVTLLRQSSERAVVEFYTGTKQTANTVARGGRKAYDSTDVRRRSIMAQRAAIVQVDANTGAIQPALIEDPLIRQNRTLSIFAVVLMVALISIVLWATSQAAQRSGGTSLGGGGFLPQSTNPPTAPVFNTPVPSATPVPQPLNWRGTLAFTLRQNGQEDIFAFQRGDSQPRRLTNNPADDRDPAWSPDGRTLAFSSNRDGNWELYLMDVITKEIRRLTLSDDYEGAPTWSPDGTFIAYEAYVNGNLDIYIVSVTGTGACAEPCQVTRQVGPDFNPSWMPQLADGGGGRRIAYTSIRGSSQDIYVIDLDNPADGAALNLTNTPDIDEDHASWSPDGQLIAYSVRIDGIEGVYFRNVNNPTEETAVGRGYNPVWNPMDGSSLFYGVPRQQTQSQIVGASPGDLGGGGDVQIINGILGDLHWMTAEPEFEAVVANYAPLFEESSQPDDTGIYGLAGLNNVETNDPFLNARVDDSFNGLRLRVMDETGRDYFGVLDDAFWRLERLPETGQARENWHYAGRAIALNRNLVLQGNPTAMVVVREDRELGVYWRVYLRVAEEAQDGSLGEPLRAIPWDFAARTSGDDLLAYEQGGRRMTTIPSGYYVDVTQLAADYGWYPQPSDRTWRQNFAGILFWEFVRTDGLTWRTAMLELYTEEDLGTIGIAPTGVDQPTATLPISETDVAPPPPPATTAEPSPTPLPPDAQ